jgi:hypothetical protein
VHRMREEIIAIGNQPIYKGMDSRPVGIGSSSVHYSWSTPTSEDVAGLPVLRDLTGESSAVLGPLNTSFPRHTSVPRPGGNSPTRAPVSPSNTSTGSASSSTSDQLRDLVSQHISRGMGVDSIGVEKISTLIEVFADHVYEDQAIFKPGHVAKDRKGRALERARSEVNQARSEGISEDSLKFLSTALTSDAFLGGDGTGSTVFGKPIV